VSWINTNSLSGLGVHRNTMQNFCSVLLWTQLFAVYCTNHCIQFSCTFVIQTKLRFLLCSINWL